MENKGKGAALLLAVLLLTGCGLQAQAPAAGENNDTGVAVTSLDVDNYFVKGENTQRFPEAPRRILVVGENETETLLELGAEKNILLAAAQNSRAYAMKEENRQKFARLPKCSSAYLNMEYVTQLDPDLIVAQQCVIIRSRLNNTAYWNERGVRTLIPLNTNTPSKHIRPETVATEMQFLRDLGKALRLEANAEKIISSTYRTIAEVNEKTRTMARPRVMVVEFLSAFICYDRTKLVGNMLELIGGQVSETPPVIGFENIIQENPDILFVVCSHADYGACIEKIWQNKALQKLPCVKNKRVYSVPLRYTYGTQCRTEDGIKFLAERLYPEAAFSWKRE